MVRTKKPREPEYRLRVFPAKDPESQKAGIAVVVETIKEFVSFHYELLLSDKREKNSITLHILGLNAPRSVMPGVGPARGHRLYAGLSGTIAVVIRNVDGEENAYKLKVRPPAVKVLSEPRHPFVVFSPEPVELSA